MMISTNLMYATSIDAGELTTSEETGTHYRTVTVTLETGQEVKFCVFAKTAEALEIHDEIRDTCVVCKCTMMRDEGPPHCQDCHPTEEHYED